MSRLRVLVLAGLSSLVFVSAGRAEGDSKEEPKKEEPKKEEKREKEESRKANAESKKSVADLNKQARKAIEAGKEEEAIARVKDLSAIGGDDAWKALFELGLGVQIPKVYKAITTALAGFTDEASQKLLETEAKSRKDLRQIYLTEILVEMKHPRAAEILGLLAEEKNPTLTRAVVAALAKKRQRESFEPLLKILERLDAARDRGQIYQEVRDALWELTGQDHDAVVDWKKWWEVAKATFDPTKKAEGATQLRKQGRETAPEFAGRKIYGKNVIFVIDTSGSMMYVMKDDIPGLGHGDGSDKGNAQGGNEKITPENSRLAKWWTRMEMAKRALLKALQAFDARARINLIRFDTKSLTFQKSLFPVSPENKKKSTDWVRKMTWKDGGNTNTMEALEDAFKSDLSTTEIYFLSDGIPSKDGQHNDPTEPILEKVEFLNRFRKIKIYTFGYDPVSITHGVEDPGLLAANKFLERLAKRTGGAFTLLKVTDEAPPKDWKGIVAGEAGAPAPAGVRSAD